MFIKKITVISGQAFWSFEVGQKVNGRIITVIKEYSNETDIIYSVRDSRNKVINNIENCSAIVYYEEE